jgi:hypothetical protein
MMEIRRVEGTEDDWDRLVWASPSGTVFHTLKFLSYHPASRFDFLNLAIGEDGDLLGVIPGGIVKVGERRLYRSPVGASFGGFTFRAGCDMERMDSAVGAFEGKMRELGLDGVEIVLAPACYRDGDRSLDFVLTSRGYGLALREATLVVPLGGYRYEGASPVLLRNLRKAKRAGVSVRTTNQPADFYKVLIKNLSAKHVKPTHTLEELQDLLSLLPDRFVLFEAVIGDRVVGGSLVVICNDRTGLAFYICDDPEKRQFRVSEALLDGAISWLKHAGYAYLDLGTVSIEGRMNWGLYRFKSKFQTITTIRERYLLALTESGLDH